MMNMEFEMAMRRISVDFNTKNMDERERVVLDDDEVQMDAVLEYEADYGGFFGVLDWSTLKDLPPQPSSPPSDPI